MPLTSAKCTSCGAELQVDSKQEAVVCKFCKSAFVVEKAISNYNIANAEINAQTLNVNLGESDFIIEKGVLKEYKGNDTDIIIPDSVKEIGEEAFKGSKYLTSVVIPDSVKEIGERAFADSSSLSSIVMPNSVVIGRDAFSGCSSLENIDIPSSIKEIGERAFADISNLSSINIPSSVEKIGREAFFGCSSLVNIDIPSSVVKIGNGAFSGCSSLVNIDIPNSVEKIGSEAFSGCSSLVSFDIPSSVKKIGYGVFSKCINITSINIPDSVVEMGGFGECKALTDVSISKNVKELGIDTFQGCEALTNIELRGSIRISGSLYIRCDFDYAFISHYFENVSYYDRFEPKIENIQSDIPEGISSDNLHWTTGLGLLKFLGRDPGNPGDCKPVYVNGVDAVGKIRKRLIAKEAKDEKENNSWQWLKACLIGVVIVGVIFGIANC